MSSVTRPRGPLPARIYWTRRLLVVGLALGMVFGLNQLLGSEPTGDDPSARPAAATPEKELDEPTLTSAPTTAPTTAAVGTQRKRRNGKDEGPKVQRTKTPLAEPNGTCLNSDVTVMPTVQGDAYAGQDIELQLELNTLESPACHWEVSAESVVVRITSGSDRIWSTQDCPAAIETQPVVVRKDHTTTVGVIWSGQRSDEECSRSTLWALPGYYHVTAAAFGGEPAEQQFRLQTPPRPTITPTPKPTKKSDKDAGADEQTDEQDKRRERR